MSDKVEYANDVVVKYAQAVYALQQQVHDLEEQQEWISIEDELPPKGAEPVLAYAGSVMIVACYYRASGWCSEETMRSICGCSTHEVTHWQPLPQPPEANDES